ncbi:Transcriptional regulator, TetR family [Leucobacter sp. 7(1)]|nr:Transcriptional regulator, TetR family [Leucobacter sp. 7(1)]
MPDKRTSAPDAIPRGQLTRAVVADAAIAHIERSGIDQLTMRSLASELGAGTMTLYTHVRGRDDLLDAVVERLIAALDMAGVTTRTRDDWRAHLEAVLDAYRALAERFPRSFELLALAPYAEGAVAPHLAGAERALAEAGLGAENARAVLGVADAFATGFLVVRARTVTRSGGADAADRSHAAESFARGVRAVIAGVEETILGEQKG